MYYNGTMINVDSSTTTLTFTAPSLPDGVFRGTVVVMVTAVNRFGVGIASDPATAVITGMHNCALFLLHTYMYVILFIRTIVIKMKKMCVYTVCTYIAKISEY